MTPSRRYVQRNLRRLLDRVYIFEAKSLTVGPGGYVRELWGRPEIPEVALWRSGGGSSHRSGCQCVASRRPADGQVGSLASSGLEHVGL